MWRARVGFGATLILNKSLAIVSGGYTDYFQVDAHAEAFDIASNRWIEVEDCMKRYRTAHSLCELRTSSGHFVYAFGGLDEKDRPLDSVERLTLGSGAVESMIKTARWELLNEVRLPLRLCNLGCLPLSQTEILLFGGVSSAEKQQWGQILQVSDVSHSFKSERFDLALPDVFTYTGDGNESAQKVKILGKQALHCFDLRRREFSVEFAFNS